jgi:hypothetical protein
MGTNEVNVTTSKRKQSSVYSDIKSTLEFPKKCGKLFPNTPEREKAFLWRI